MKLVYLYTFFAALVSVALAAPAQNKTEHCIKLAEKDLSVDVPTSRAAPEDVPISIHKLEQAAAIASQQYCSIQTPGTQVGDAKLLWSSGLVLAFEGTSVTGRVSWFEDFDFVWSDPDSRYKASLSSGAKIHTGFQIAYTKIADKAMEQVKSFMKKKNKDKVTVVGHSLGASIAVLSALHLETEMQGSVDQILTFGQPRVDNVQFASDVDKHFKDKFYYTINGADPVARLGPRILGFQHASGQIWINPASSTNWKFYPGQENIHGSISSIPLPLLFVNHIGTYFHTHIDHYYGFWECPAKASKDLL
ncbi:hypothetical protein MNAN1_002786 [Malassezia nana]|uniref:Fungal lipase-type domain-containing protein n=1 Tax=Malassezia nana TaxID=180528 RepID=A0AAF0ES39_9BASI|nr:hypothetical protein MNAN1_002786 [Malassezia nana]